MKKIKKWLRIRICGFVFAGRLLVRLNLVRNFFLLLLLLPEEIFLLFFTRVLFDRYRYIVGKPFEIDTLHGIATLKI